MYTSIVQRSLNSWQHISFSLLCPVLAAFYCTFLLCHFISFSINLVISCLTYTFSFFLFLSFFHSFFIYFFHSFFLSFFLTFYVSFFVSFFISFILSLSLSFSLSRSLSLSHFFFLLWISHLLFGILNLFLRNFSDSMEALWSVLTGLYLRPLLHIECHRRFSLL